jgi:hypothetical protein
MFGSIFKKKQPQQVPATLIVATLNARIQPIHRGEFFVHPEVASWQLFAIALCGARVYE